MSYKISNMMHITVFRMKIISKPVFKSECMSLIRLLEICMFFFFKRNLMKKSKKINREQIYNDDDELSLAFIICGILIVIKT